MKVILHYLQKCNGSVFYLDDSNRGFVVGVAGPVPAPSPKQELFDRAYVKVFVHAHSGPNTPELGELAHKLKMVCDRCLRIKEFPRAFVSIALQPLTAHSLSFPVALKALTLALLDSRLPMDFVPVLCESSFDDEFACVNPLDSTIVYCERQGIVVAASGTLSDDSSVSQVRQNLQWLIGQMSSAAAAAADVVQ